MSLDVAILGENGEPETTVPIRVDAHARLLGMTERATSPLLSRLRDYYEDAEYNPGELDSLTSELEVLVQRVRGDDELAKKVEELISLVAAAKRLGRQVVAIAD